ncbi:aspartate/glutamate racemase family protein [Leekyejoonella antrihumi]|uniref:Aspartate/glutamate racemase family protein n=1 Tax=Leekyejoonella antrihumi TaxID=1660198 RepID=A0A563E0C4_9MICO|nr:aspartate/glutamate racemase family protein [Leekyejoonella antrihumi]TWP35966.1 aspartate/glutamate racemase family protein [Leekyejoonella antrihumi]
MTRTIGMIGGMSWESTACYYRLANELVAQRLGGLHSAPVLLSSLDFAPIEAMQVAGEWDRAGRLLADEAVRLQSAGAELLLLCTNTMHKVAGAIEQACDIPLIHVADVTAQAALRQGSRRVALLGTAFTMEQDFYRERLEQHGLQVLAPEATDRALVHRVIYEELCRGVLRDDSREAYRQVISRMVDRGCDGVVLGCTEIEMLLTASRECGVPLFPTTRLHVEAAVDLACA